MSHYVYCHSPFNLSAGGTVGYLSRLYSALQEFTPSMKTYDGAEMHFNFADREAQPRYLRDIPSDIFLGQNSCFDLLIRTLEKHKHFDPSCWLINKYERCFRELPKFQVTQKNDPHKSIHINGSYNFFPIWNQLRLQGQASSTIKILTTHNPWVPYVEDMSIRSTANKWSKKELDLFGQYMQLRDRLAFTLCDAILCPSEFSLDGYKEWEFWNEISKNKPIYYCITGAPPRIIMTSRKQLREKLGIPESELVILYLGRKEKVRGFDLFVNAARQVLATTRKIWFIAVGNGNLKVDINDQHFIDLGFSTHAGDFINAADACVSTNRVSYFDLSMIEILSQGCPLITSNVGGYTWLKGRTRGVLFFEQGNDKELVKKILDFCTFSQEIKKEMHDSNITVYKEHLTPFHFQDNYKKAIDAIRRDLGKETFSRTSENQMVCKKILSKNQEKFNFMIHTLNSFFQK